MEKKSQNKKGELKAIGLMIAEILNKEEVTKQIASNVIEYITRGRVEKYRESKSEIWKKILKNEGVKLAKECNIERIIEMFPLENEEIRQVVKNIKTRKESKDLNYEMLRKYVMEVLGDNLIKKRKADIMRKKLPVIQKKPDERIGRETLHRRPEIEKIYNHVLCGNTFLCDLTSSYARVIRCASDFAKICLEPHAKSQVCQEEYTCGSYYFCGLTFAHSGPELPERDKCPGFFDPIEIF